MGDANQVLGLSESRVQSVTDSQSLDPNIMIHEATVPQYLCT